MSWGGFRWGFFFEEFGEVYFPFAVFEGEGYFSFLVGVFVLFSDVALPTTEIKNASFYTRHMCKGSMPDKLREMT